MRLIRTNIYKRKYGVGKVSWMVRWKDQKTGLWKARTAGRTKEEALLVEADIRQELLQGVDPTPKHREETVNPSLADAIEQFYKHSKFLVRSKTDKDQITARMDKIVKPAFGGVKFRSLTTDSIIKFYLELKNEREITNSTLTKYHHNFCSIGDVFEEKYPDFANPFRKIRNFTKIFPAKTPTREINFLVQEEFDRIVMFLEARKNFRIIPFVKFLWLTGMRRSEALNLKWTDVDWQNDFINIRKSKNHKSRKVPIDSEVKELLKSMKTPGDYIVSNEDGTRPHPDSFIKHFKRAAKRAGIKKRIDLHSLRHSFGSNKIRQGWGLKKVSVLLGHADINTTAEIYSHLLDGDLRVKDEVLDNSTQVIKGEPSTPTLEAKLVQLEQLLSAALQQIEARELRKEKEQPVESRNDSTVLDRTQNFATLLLQRHMKTALETNNLKTSETLTGANLEAFLLSKTVSPTEDNSSAYALRKRCSTN